MTQKFNEIEKTVLNRITPSKEDRKKLDTVIHELTEKVQQEIDKQQIPAIIELVGSTAKDTYLKDNLDVDLFLLFPPSFSKETIATYALSIGRTLLKDTEECYAEHPYIRGYFKNYKVEIVPCYKIEDATQKLSAVDRTPLHTRFVQNHLLETQKQDVRLFKQFLKGINCYGAEAEIEGFSGYLCEIIIIKFESFQKLLQNAQHWRYGEKLALDDNQSYPSFDTPLTFIDPVDSERNVASALSKEKFELFVKACQAYLTKPRITFFFPNEIKPWSVTKIRETWEKQAFHYVGIRFTKPAIIAENLYPQIRKACRSIWKACQRQGFIIDDVTFYVDDQEEEILIIIKTDAEPLSETTVHIGPPVQKEKNKKQFIEKWKNHPRIVKPPFEQKGRLYVELKREYREITEFLRDNLRSLSMGKHIDQVVNQNYEILEMNEMLKDKYRGFWTQYLDAKPSWER